MESFFSLLRKTVPDLKVWTTLEEPPRAILAWIERDCTLPQRLRALGRHSLVEPELALWSQPAPQAA